MNKQIENAVRVLNEGGIIIFPTDTAYGIGCRIDKISSVEKLFEIRKRPKTQATPVLVSSILMAKEYAKKFPTRVEKLIDKFWPGALTVIVDAKISKVPKLVRGGSKTVGLRMPNNKIILEIISRIGVPILGPSANFHGEETPYSLSQVSKELIQKADYVVDGNCDLKIASTVVDATSEHLKILREGAIKKQEIFNNKHITLLIDTSKNSEAEVGIRVNGKTKLNKKELTAKKREIVLSLIDELLKNEKLSLYDLTDIEVVTGPGSFTGLRVGISIANAFSNLMKIPVNNKKIGDLENAVYN